ncbi:MAG: mechanosensitive ion channel family protein [Opitutaceae bacterium]|jgi:small-conductance mechanosensitive channel|nr:mechanosensitive ion channel family protein [Opitutaceae bacterium]
MQGDFLFWLTSTWQKILAVWPALLLIAALGLVANFVLRHLSSLVATRTSPIFLQPLRRAGQVAVIVVALVIVMSVLGFNPGDIWTLLSTVLAMIAIGFVAVWSVLSNVSCTMVILMSRTFEVGDEIEFTDPAGVRGKVINLNFIYATLQDEDGRLIQVPNNMFFQKIIKRRPEGKGTVSLAEQLERKPDALP